MSRTTRTLVPALLLGLLLTACGDDGSPTVEDAGGGTDTSGAGGGGGDGTINVRLEETQGIFVEGFEVGLRFDGPDGEIDRVLWTEFVTANADASDPEAFYDSVLAQPVPAGTVTVGADVRIGIGPGPTPPDLDAETLPCELEVEVPAGGEVTVEVSFSGESGCVTLVG